MMNPNWNRWISTSINKHFVDAGLAATPPWTAELEPQEYPLSGRDRYAEIRIAGPNAKELTKGKWRLEVTVNLLLNVMKDSKDWYRMFRFCGLIQQSFAKCITVYKYGDTTADDESVSIGELRLITQGDIDIETVHFGQVAPDQRLLQSTVEGNYRIFLEDR